MHACGRKGNVEKRGLHPSLQSGVYVFPNGDRYGEHCGPIIALSFLLPPFQKEISLWPKDPRRTLERSGTVT